jgi:hypothetical protein
MAIARTIAFLILVVLCSVQGLADSPEETKLSAEAAWAKDAVQKILPEGWSVTKVVDRTIPDDWVSYENSGILVESSDEKQICRAWFLPHMWVGIRTSRLSRPRTGNNTRFYWLKAHKVIAYCPYPEINMFKELYGSYFEQSQKDLWKKAFLAFERNPRWAGKEVTKLVEQYCDNERCRSVAARSLDFIKVPAFKTLIDCATDGHGRERAYCIQSLAHFGGNEVVELFKKLLSDANATDDVISSVINGLDVLECRDIGPSLVNALGRTNSLSTAARITRVLASLEYREAAPEILKWLKKNSVYYNRDEFIDALAFLDYREASEHIEKICSEFDLFSTDVWKNRTHYMSFRSWRPSRGIEFACRNYLGPWGKPQNDIRMQLIPPRKAKVGKSIDMTMIFENGSKVHINNPRYFSVGFMIDGSRQTVEHESPSFYTGSIYLRSKHFQVVPVELPKKFNVPGKHKIQCVWSYGEFVRMNRERKPIKKPFSGTVYSNIIEVEVTE